MGNLRRNLVVNEILLRRKHALIIPKQEAKEYNSDVAPLVLSLMKNIEFLGFTFSMNAVDQLLRCGKNEMIVFSDKLITALKKLVGADVQYNPMYPNFPQQVADANEAELFINAVVHYITYGMLIPDYEKKERMPLINHAELTVLDVTLDEHHDLLEIMSNLLSSKTSLSSQDKEDVQEIVLSVADYFTALPDYIPLKENVAFISKLIIEKAPIKSAADIQKYYATATDVLRLVVALSDGDISLAEKTKFRSLRRYERRMIMDLLSGCSNILEDMFRYRDEWIRVAEIIHVGEYHSAKYEKVLEAFHTLRNESKPLMYGGMLEECISNGGSGIDKAVKMLIHRPGEFARRLDKLLRDSWEPAYVLDMFEKVASNVSSPVLLQVRQHFIGRKNIDYPVRVFFKKGNTARAVVKRNDLPNIRPEICDRVVRICECALEKIYKDTKDPMGKVYVDPDMKNYMVPFSQRSASSGSKMLVRGSIATIREDVKTLRAFIWWTNAGKNGGRVDLDLSACILDEHFNYISRISYTNLRDGQIGCLSGDMVDGGDVNGSGVSEFIDINIDAAAKRGRYVCFQVYSFTWQTFALLPNCRFGWMEREDMNSGEIFEPSTVEMRINLTSNSIVSVPVIFDCKERKLVWLDMNLSIDNIRDHRANNIENGIDDVRAVCYAMMHLNKPNMYDLAMLNARALGTVVENRDDADLIFSNDKSKPIKYVSEDQEDGSQKVIPVEKDVTIVTPFDLDYFMGKLL